MAPWFGSAPFVVFWAGHGLAVRPCGQLGASPLLFGASRLRGSLVPCGSGCSWVGYEALGLRSAWFGFVFSLFGISRVWASRGADGASGCWCCWMLGPCRAASFARRVSESGRVFVPRLARLPTRVGLVSGSCPGFRGCCLGFGSVAALEFAHSWSRGGRDATAGASRVSGTGLGGNTDVATDFPDVGVDAAGPASTSPTLTSRVLMRHRDRRCGVEWGPSGRGGSGCRHRDVRKHRDSTGVSPGHHRDVPAP